MSPGCPAAEGHLSYRDVILSQSPWQAVGVFLSPHQAFKLPSGRSRPQPAFEHGHKPFLPPLREARGFRRFCCALSLTCTVPSSPLPRPAPGALPVGGSGGFGTVCNPRSLPVKTLCPPGRKSAASPVCGGERSAVSRRGLTELSLCLVFHRNSL